VKPKRGVKEHLRGTDWFALVDPAELENLDEFADWLASLLNDRWAVYETDHGYEIGENLQLVARIDGLKNEVYPREHPPPHFHVKSANIDASFAIDDCRRLEGDIRDRDLVKVMHFHNYAKSKLVDAWNSTRPTQCCVGFITTEQTQ